MSTGRTFPTGVGAPALLEDRQDDREGTTRPCSSTGFKHCSITGIDSLNTELAAWQQATNAERRQVDWQFTTADARIKLRHLYPNS